MRRWRIVLASGVALAAVGSVGLNVVQTVGPAPLATAVAGVDSAGCPTAQVPITKNVTTKATSTATVVGPPVASVNPTSGVTTTSTPTATTTTTTTATSKVTTGHRTVKLPNCPYVPWLKGWRPKLGPVFNDPLGSKRDATANVRRVYNAIMKARKGSQIKIAVYSFDRSEIAYALRKAKKRGVSVQIIVNGSVMSGVARKLQRELGKNPKKKNFLIACEGRCRKAGDGGNQHNKVFAFSQAGGARYLVITSSGNLTSKAVYRQWNDSYAVANDKKLYDTWVKMFGQMKVQKQSGKRTLTYTTQNGDYKYWFQRTASDMAAQQATMSSTVLSKYSAKSDRAVSQLKKIGCKAPAGYGVKGRTTIRLAMYAMFGARGKTMTKLLIEKKKQGCDVQIILSVPGSDWKKLTKAGIGVRSADWMFAERNPDLEDGIKGFGPRFYSHLKFLAVNGRYNGQPSKFVITGSENWSGISMANEEVVLQINDAKVHRAYLNQFNKMYNSVATHRMGVKPVGGPSSDAAIVAAYPGMTTTR